MILWFRHIDVSFLQGLLNACDNLLLRTELFEWLLLSLLLLVFVLFVKIARQLGQLFIPCAFKLSIHTWWNHDPQHPGENNGTPPLAWDICKQIEHCVDVHVVVVAVDDVVDVGADADIVVSDVVDVDFIELIIE